MTRDHFRFITGVNPGYLHDNECPSPLQAVIDAWDRVSQDPPRYIPAIMTSAKCIYRKEWGCPGGGEDVVIVEGDRNPEFSPVDLDWATNVASQCRRVREELKQNTATLTFFESDFLYLR